MNMIGNAESCADTAIEAKGLVKVFGNHRAVDSDASRPLRRPCHSL